MNKIKKSRSTMVQKAHSSVVIFHSSVVTFIQFSCGFSDSSVVISHTEPFALVVLFVNPLTLNIKEQIFLSCPHAFLYKNTGERLLNIKNIHLG